MLLQPIAELGDNLPRRQDAGIAGAEVIVQLAAAVAGLGLTALFASAVVKAVAVVDRHHALAVRADEPLLELHRDFGPAVAGVAELLLRDLLDPEPILVGPQPRMPPLAQLVLVPQGAVGAAGREPAVPDVRPDGSDRPGVKGLQCVDWLLVAAQPLLVGPPYAVPLGVQTRGHLRVGMARQPH